MGDQFWLTEEQVERLRPHVPKVRRKARSDDRTVLSGIIHVKRNGLRGRDAPAVYGPHKTLYNRFRPVVGAEGVCSYLQRFGSTWGRGRPAPDRH